MPSPAAAGPVLLVLAAAALYRLTVGLHPYSGSGTPPKYGDYEAQRHWMELTTNLPPSAWYTNSSVNDLGYWGLDYPPVSAYQSWLHGKAVGYFEPRAVALGDSRGFESPFSKLLLRWTVVLSDLAIFFPAALWCVSVFGADASPGARAWALAAILLQPAAVLIDHGHFQYNCISLGFAAAAAAAIGSGRDLLGSALFCLALNHKQMSLYYAPAFFAHLLGKCLRRPTALDKVWGVGRLGLVVVATFAACWHPYLGSVDAALGVLGRLAPLQRGLYEDYVANWWCATAPLVKWRALLSRQALVRVCAGATLLAAAPSMLHQMLRPSRQGLLLAMACSAFAFFLFSYQVHEKSILLPVLPVTLLAPHHPGLAAWLPALAAFSMFPLLKKDGLVVAYAGSLLLWAALAWPPAFPTAPPQAPGSGRRAPRSPVPPAPATSGAPRGWRPPRGLLARAGAAAPFASTGACLAVHAVATAVPPPARYPFLFDAAVVSLAFLHFAGAAAHLNLQLWRLGWRQEKERTE